uniref:winged helix-turn-helix domain-containing protein n=1 Tax=Natrinema salaciae TaxID=1186196 RepID=UPI001FE17E4A|nr:winged helix-turn-helix domain-containing protein [Natrinema salaciae]
MLGHEIRLEILAALIDEWVAAYTEPCTYAELMDAVDMQDSGKFNYHLGKLRGIYVEKVDDGYVPTAATTALYRTVLAYQPNQDIDRTRFTVDSACPSCGSEPVGTYERGFLSVDCDSCAEWVGFSYPFPKHGFENRSDDDAVRVAHRRCKHHVQLAHSGQCPFCAGPTTSQIRADALEEGNEPTVTIDCDSCSFRVGPRILFLLLLDPSATTALTDIGIDIDQYEWELPDPRIRIVSSNPLRVRVEIDGEERTAAIVIDESLDVCSVVIDQ